MTGQPEKETPPAGSRVPRDFIIPALAAIVLLAAFLRLWNLSLSPQWYGDECVELILSRDFSSGRLAYDGREYRTMVPHFSFSPPLYPEMAGLFMKTALALTNGERGLGEDGLDGIYGARLYTSLLAILAIIPLYLLSRELSGPGAAIAASLLYAVHPVVVEHNRFGFRHNQSMLFNLVFLAAIAMAARRSRRQSGLLPDIAGAPDIGSPTCGAALETAEIRPEKVSVPLILLAGLAAGMSLFSSYRSYAIFLAAAVLIPVVLFSGAHGSSGRKRSLAVWAGAALLAVLPGLIMYLPFVARDGAAFFTNFKKDVGSNIFSRQPMLDNVTREGSFGRIKTGLIQSVTTDPLTVAGAAGMAVMAMKPGAPRWTAAVFFISLISIAHRQEDVHIFFYPFLLVAPLFSLGAAHLLALLRNSPRLAIVLLLSAATFLGLGSWHRVTGRVQPAMAFLSVKSIEDTGIVAEYLNSRTDREDLVITDPCLGWLLRSRRSTILESMGYETGLFPPYFRLPMPRDRFLYDPSFEKATYIVLAGIDQAFTLKQPGVIHHLQSAIYRGNWFVEFTRGEYTVIKNPAR